MIVHLCRNPALERCQGCGMMVMMPDADDVDYLAGTKMRGDAISIHIVAIVSSELVCPSSRLCLLTTWSSLPPNMEALARRPRRSSAKLLIVHVAHHKRKQQSKHIQQAKPNNHSKIYLVGSRSKSLAEERLERRLKYEHEALIIAHCPIIAMLISSVIVLASSHRLSLLMAMGDAGRISHFRHHQPLTAATRKSSTAS